MSAKVGNHHFIHAEVLLVSKPFATVFVEVIEDGPDL
jgi:hypothetical protein